MARTGRFLTPHALVLIGALSLILGTAAVVWLQRDAGARKAEEVAYLQLSERGRALATVVLEAAVGERSVPSAQQEVAVMGSEMNERIEENLERDPEAAVRALDRALDDHLAAVDRTLAAMFVVGARPARAHERERLRRSLAVLDARLAGVRAVQGRDAAIAARRAEVLSGLTLVLMLALLLALTRRHQREVSVRESEALAHSEARFRALVDDNSDLVLTVDAHGRISDASRACRHVLGFDPEQVIGRPLAELVHGDDLSMLDATATAGVARRTLDWRMRHANGYWQTVETAVNDMTGDPRVRSLVLTVRDVSERKAFEQQLRHRAFHDPLTQLPNRALFHDRLQHALGREDRYEQQVGVVFIDLDDFKVVNDTLGHAAGDELLTVVASRIRSCLRSGDTPARLGGDEFAVLLESVPHTDYAVAVAERILAAFKEPAILGGHAVALKSSIGVALGDAEVTSADELQRNADIAMYAAKAAGKEQHVVFRADRHAELVRRFPSRGGEADRTTWFARSEEQRNEVLRLLREEGGIVPVFQPIMRLATGALAGWEALARFPGDPDRRPPNVWFAQAHRCGLGPELERRAIQAALDVPRRPSGTRLALNISPAALRTPEVLDRLPADLGGIIVEVTEHELVADNARLAANLGLLRERGAAIAVDDAGAGYAGLRQLAELRPDLIKIDRSLIERVAEDPARQALVDSFVRFAERTGAEVCAEGIETLADLEVLTGLGVTYGQGYAIARPAPPWPDLDRTCAAEPAPAPRELPLAA